MTSFVSAALAAFMILGCGAAQAAGPAVSAELERDAAPVVSAETERETARPAVSAELERETAARIAGEWGVDPSALTLEWGHVPAPATEPGAALLRLVGRGTDGWLAAVIRPAEGRALSVRVRAGLTDSVWVAARPLEAGTVLAAEDLRGEVQLRWGPPRSAFERPGPGWEVRRRVAAGTTLAPPAVSPPAWVTAGEPVTLEWNRGGVSIALTGTALNSAREGGTVRARIPGRDAPVSGVVTAPGTATLLKAGRT